VSWLEVLRLFSVVLLSHCTPAKAWRQKAQCVCVAAEGQVRVPITAIDKAQSWQYL
jgi:hypothetical protein